MNPLAKPLRYLIGTDTPGNGKIGEIIEVGYDVDTPPPVGLAIKYVNLFDEKNTGEYGPYLSDSDTAQQYNEGQIDPNFKGWTKNLTEQFTRARNGGFKYVELDNPDAYKLVHFMQAVALAETYGLGVIAKNPGLDYGGDDATQAVAHPNCFGIIVERGAGRPSDMHAMRVVAGKSELPVWFVAFGSGRGWANDMAAEAKSYVNMWVTYSRAGEYGSSEDVGVKRLPSIFEPGAQIPYPGDSMAEPAHLTLARSLIGKYTDGPDVPKLAMEIASAFPEMTAYCRLASINTSWCGIFVFAVMVRAYGLRPPYTPPGDGVGSFMWADAPINANWGTIVPNNQAQPGDIVVLREPHHINFFVRNDGDRYWGIGGNQSNKVTEAPFDWDGVRAVIRPPASGAAARPLPPPASLRSSNFDKCLPLLLEHEGGYSNHPSDPGGPTNFGITIHDYRMYIDPNGSAADVRAMSVDQAKVIYRQKYWDAMSCDDLPSGVDYAIFDYGVNSGIGRAPKVLQRIVIPHEVDGEIGPNTIAATAQADPRILIGQICDERLAFLQGLRTWPTFGNGWGRRVREVRAAALEMAATPKEPNMPKAPDIQVFPPGTQIPGQIDPQQLARVVTEAVQAAMPQIIAAVRQGLGPIALPGPVDNPTQQPPPSGGVSVPGAVTGLTLSGILGGLMGEGMIGTPFGLGQAPSIWGTISTIGAFIAPFIGGAGVGNGILNAGSKLLGFLGFERKKTA